MRKILTGTVLWSYDYEVLNRNVTDNIKGQVSGFKPFHRHKGTITLTTESIIINGDECLQIPLSSLNQIYLGFDETFPRTLVRNMGLFWQPLRISLSNGQKFYMIIDYNFFGTRNRSWFGTLKELLSVD
jgi:hypothetical protein